MGYMRLEYLWSIVPYIALIQVLPEYRRQGVGKALLRFHRKHFSARQVMKHSIVHRKLTKPETPSVGIGMWGFEECGFIAGINEGGR